MLGALACAPVAARAADQPGEAPAAAPAPAAPLRAAITGTTLSLAVPAGWGVEREVVGAAVVLRSPAPTASQAADPAQAWARGVVSASVERRSPDETPAAYAAHCRADLERTGTDVAIDEQGDEQLAGHAWVRLTYRMSIGQFSVRQVLRSTIIAGAGICVVCASGDAHFADWQADFANIIGGLGRSRPELAP